MNRRSFLYLSTSIPLVAATMKLKALDKLTEEMESTKPMPVLFVGHGSPMNAIELNEYSRTWQKIGSELPKPNAILCVSAHWETRGTYVTAAEKPKTIHDFGGFPDELFSVQYPAAGSPALAETTIVEMKPNVVSPDTSWGLDHGAWSILRHLYPAADVPVVQLSLDYYRDPQSHFELAKQLSKLREKGILIIGSGNMVHNLRMVDWHNPDKGFDWANEANLKFKQLIADGDFKSLIEYTKLGREIALSVPTPEHFLPLLYTLALKKKNESLSFFNDKTLMGSLSMTSVMIGNS